MSLNERRQYFRIEDQMYFNYRILKPGERCSDRMVLDEFLGESDEGYLETSQYFQKIDYELAELTKVIALKETTLAHCLNLLNAKIDYLSRQMLMKSSVKLCQVNISLGGMSFETPKLIKEDTHLKLVLYTKPKMTPLIIEGTVVYSKYQKGHNHHTAVSFCELTKEQEQVLSQHILMAQVTTRSD